MSYKKIIHALFFLLAFQIAIPAKARWLDAMGDWLGNNDNQKRSIVAVAAVGIGYFMYRCWKKQPIVVKKKIHRPTSSSEKQGNDSDDEPRSHEEKHNGLGLPPKHPVLKPSLDGFVAKRSRRG